LKRQLPIKFALSLNLILFLVGCTATKGSKENVSIVTPPKVTPTPSVVTQSNTKTQGTKDKELKEIFTKIKEIEENFISQNCTEVLSKAKSLEAFTKKINFNSFPPMAQAGIYVCDARAGLDNPTRVQKAISILNGLQLRYPVINEAWLHNTLADFYFALGDKPNALIEKKAARDLILAQQLDISSLNAQILQLNPSEPSIKQNPNSTTTSDPSNLNLDQIASSASQMLNNDSPEQAIALIDNIPTDQRNDALKRIRSDAVNTLVMNLRYKVRALFVRSTQQTGTARKETLSQCEQILQGIMKNYPEYSDMTSVQNNLKQVQRELAKP
jgi:hypothetical protein